MHAIVWTETPGEKCTLGEVFDDSQASVAWDTLCDVDKADIRAVCVHFMTRSHLPLAGYPALQAGLDFWLTRNRHGMGFSDYDFSTPEVCDVLHALAKGYGEASARITEEGNWLYFDRWGYGA